MMRVSRWQSGRIKEVTRLLSLFRVFLARGRTREMPKNAALDQIDRRRSAFSVFFRVLSSLAMEQ